MTWVVMWLRLDGKQAVLYTVVHHAQPHLFRGLKCAGD